MITPYDLRTALLDLLFELRESDVRLIIGGGYGIYLKTTMVSRLQAKTLFRHWPEPRSTQDLDLFLRPELLIASAKLKPLADAIDKLGYQVVRGAEKYQFAKPGPRGDATAGIKIDLLTGPRIFFTGTTVTADARRAKPNPSVGIHAHPLDEAPTLLQGLIPFVLEGELSNGDLWRGEIFLPHPFTFSMMKLFAFRDRLEDEDKDFGRYHALDIYTILATMTEGEWAASIGMRDQFRDDPVIQESGMLVDQYFSDIDRLGMIRLRESPYFRSELQLDDFMSALQEIFPA